MIDVTLVNRPLEKSQICGMILKALPNWFGNQAAVMEYTSKAANMDMFAAFGDDGAVGFASLKAHSRYACEIAVMGVLEEYHYMGIGSRLVAACEGLCRGRGAEFLTVKTLDEADPHEGYGRTRSFYLAKGFRPLEVFPLYWDKDNPCLFLAKWLG